MVHVGCHQIRRRPVLDQSVYPVQRLAQADIVDVYPADMHAITQWMGVLSVSAAEGSMDASAKPRPQCHNPAKKSGNARKYDTSGFPSPWEKIRFVILRNLSSTTAGVSTKESG